MFCYPPTMASEALKVTALFILPWAGGVFSALVTRGQPRDWFDRLLKAPWNPPSWVFGPAWSILYILIGWSSYEFYISGGSSIGWGLYATQLCLNWLWSPLFFGLHNANLAFIDILLMLLFIILTMAWFAKVSVFATVLLTPYLLWVIFAASLNGFIILNN